MELRPRRSRQEPPSQKLTAVSRFPWYGLPVHVKAAILSELAGDYEGVQEEGRQRCAVYASICSEWQKFFEKIVFQKLVLHAPDLDGFANIIKRRTGGVETRNSLRASKNPKLATGAFSSTVSRMPRIKHLWLRVELLPYDCPECRRAQSPAEVVRNNIIFTKAVWRLLEILSQWEKVDADHGQELTLELSAHSPSDLTHKLMLNAVEKDDYPFRAGISAQREYIMRCHKDKVGMLVNELRSRNHDIGSISRIPLGALHLYVDRTFAERPLSRLDFDLFRVNFNAGQRPSRLPEVKMVASLLLRRQHYRTLSNNALRTLVEESLTGLRDLRFERWRLADPSSQELEDWKLGLALISPLGAGGILGSKVPSPLETLSLFEDFSENMHGANQFNEPRPSRLKLLALVANYAVNIKHLSVSFLSDAKDCLDLSGHTFPKLQSIALTSQHWLEPTEENTEKLLLLAAKAAETMPSLQIMEIWNCRNGHAAIFRYEATGTSESSASRLTWRCSWDIPEKPIVWSKVIAAWRHVASTIAGRELRFTQDPLPRVPYQYRTYGGIMHQLKLRNWILDPTSVMQVRMRTAAENEPEVEAWRPSVPDSYWSQR